MGPASARTASGSYRFLISVRIPAYANGPAERLRIDLVSLRTVEGVSVRRNQQIQGLDPARIGRARRRSPQWLGGDTAANFYDKGFSIGFTDQQKSDLAGFLNAPASGSLNKGGISVRSRIS
jgi:hypothetical protein